MDALSSGHGRVFDHGDDVWLQIKSAIVLVSA